MAVSGSYKDGGSGKGCATRDGLDLNKFGANLDKTHGTRKLNCLDCRAFKGVDPGGMVNCLLGKNQEGFIKCPDFVKK